MTPSAPSAFIFKKLFGEAAIANFNQKQLEEYEENLKIYRDMKGALDTAREEGREEERFGIARGMKQDGLDLKTIAKYTGLPVDEIERL